MKKFILSYILTVLICLVQSPGFTQVPLNWSIDEVNPGEDVSISADETFFTEGAKSCHMQLMSGSVPYLISDYFFVTAGSDYQFSIDVFDDDTTGQVKVYADFYDAYGFTIYGEPAQFSRDTSIWQTISWQGIVPAQAVVGYVLVKYYCQPNLYSYTNQAEAWIDNTRFQEGNGDNLVANGGFENWAVGVAEGKTISEGLKIYPNPAGDHVKIDLLMPVYDICITDLTGREWIRMNGNGVSSFRIDLTHLITGIYMIRANVEGGQMLTSPLVVQH